MAVAALGTKVMQSVQVQNPHRLVMFCVQDDVIRIPKSMQNHDACSKSVGFVKKKYQSLRIVHLVQCFYNRDDFVSLLGSKCKQRVYSLMLL